jgi:hypothetical protein
MQSRAVCGHILGVKPVISNRRERRKVIIVASRRVQFVDQQNQKLERWETREVAVMIRSKMTVAT